MVITLLNLIGLALLIVLATAGYIIKKITERKVQDLEGFGGTVKKGREHQRGSVIGIL